MCCCAGADEAGRPFAMAHPVATQSQHNMGHAVRDPARLVDMLLNTAEIWRRPSAGPGAAIITHVCGCPAAAAQCECRGGGLPCRRILESRYNEFIVAMIQGDTNKALSLPSASVSLSAAVKAVVFDMDGLLLNTEALARQALHFAGPEVGLELTDSFCALLIGVPAETCRRQLLDHCQ
jgi:hypothetical protein